jgi:hypothetical protein
MAAEYGPPPAVAYPELAHYSDRELLERDRSGILAEIQQQRAAIARLIEQAQQIEHQEAVR